MLPTNLATSRQDLGEPVSISSQPKEISIPDNLRLELPSIRSSLENFCSIDLKEPLNQKLLRETLLACPAWADWIGPHQGSVKHEPILVRRGLGIEADDQLSRVLLVGLALTLEPGHVCPPYSIGNSVVTEVIAEAGASMLSHSMNDLPAPPHCAGFFEPVPPHTCYFSCIRPHLGGGAQTTVLNLPRILAQTPQSLLDEWSNNVYFLRTSTRMGGEILPFKLLRWVEGAPFLRYRKECMVGFNQEPSLKILEELVSNPANHYIVGLQAGETLVHWNGAPHSRLPQNGATPENIEARRKLIRCRSLPENWSNIFEAECSLVR